MLPDPEVRFLLTTIMDATDLAHAGKIAEGYQVLRAGLRRAEEIRDGGAIYGEELVRRWQEAVARFAERYRIGRA